MTNRDWRTHPVLKISRKLQPNSVSILKFGHPMEITTTTISTSKSEPEVRAPIRDDQKRPKVVDGYQFEAELAFTETYRRFRDEHPAIREGMCLKTQTPFILDDIRDGDLLAGRLEPKLVGFSPDEWGQTAFGYYALPDAIDLALSRSGLDSNARRRVEEMRDFWRTETTAAKVRAAYPSDLVEWLPSDNWMGEPGIAFPLYRLTGGTVNYDRLIRLGIPGLLGAVSGMADSPLRSGMLAALEALVDAAGIYERHARTRAEWAAASRRRDLLRLADALAHIAAHPPSSFFEGVQLMWLYSIVADLRNHGRMDVYLGDLLAADLNSGRLTEAEALRILQSLWSLMADRNTRVHNRVIVGGLGRRNEINADRFALLALEASRTVLEAEPQLSLRFYDGMNPELMARGLDVIGQGRTFPMLYNDDVNVPAVMSAFDVDRASAEQYVPFGCGEYILEGRSFGTPSGVINLLAALNATLRNGRDPVSGRQVGLDVGCLADFDSFDQLWHAYTQQVEHFVALMARQQKIEYDVAGREASFLYLSMLYDDCITRGEAMFSGGVRHLGGTLETYGNTNTADSLTAVRRLVYEEGRLSVSELMAALDVDFEGHSRIRGLLHRAPKYGNDDDEADAMLVRVHEHVCNATRRQAAEVGLDSYLVVNINNSANTLMGRRTAASADGRRALTPMNNGNNPSSGNDRKGVTAFLNSIVKPPSHIHAGAVQNMKFSPELFGRHRSKLEALLSTYFEEGGAQAMITVVNRDDLERALENPSAYAHIFVRVGGFSARFVDLPRDVQQEILERALY